MSENKPSPPRGKSSVNQLTPNAIEVTINKKSLRVASSKEENNMMNMIVMAQMRHMIQSQLKQYDDAEIRLTPKEIKDLADAIKSMAGASQEIYALQDKSSSPRNEIPADKDMPLGSLTFDVAATLAEEKKPDETGTDTDEDAESDGDSPKA